MTHSVEQIAAMIGGEISGDKDVRISKVAKIEEADSESICFISNKKYLHFLDTTEAGAVIVDSKLDTSEYTRTLIKSEQPYVAFCTVLIKLFDYKDPNTGVHPKAIVEDSAQIGESCYIGPGAYIGHGVTIADGCKIYANTTIYENCSIGEQSILYSNVSVYHDCHIGAQNIIHSGTVIGSDGFGHAPLPDGTYIKIPQIGNVITHKNVEIGSNCSIDRANMGSTIIHEGCRIDNLIQIAHGVEVGKHTVVAAQAGISGSTKVGEHCIIAGQVGIVGHISIADKVQIGAQSGVSNDIKDVGGKFTDSPHMPLSQAIRSRVLYKKLPELEKRITDLERSNKTQEK